MLGGGMRILKQAEANYLPTVDIGYYTYDYPAIEVTLTLEKLPTQAEFDALRQVLKQWANDCGYGELKQGLQ